MNPNGVGINLHCITCKIVFRVWFESAVKGSKRVASKIDELATDDIWKCVKCGVDTTIVEDGLAFWLILSYHYTLPVEVIKQIWEMWDYKVPFDRFIKQLLKEATET